MAEDGCFSRFLGVFEMPSGWLSVVADRVSGAAPP